VQSDRYPDGTRVELSEDEAIEQIGADAVSYARYDDEQQVVRLEVTTRGAPKAPPMWFVEVRESTARPPAINLMAFTGHGVEPGTLVAHTDVTSTGVTTADQLGAIRWYPATGEIDQIYVTPSWRRRSIGTVLVIVGTTLSVARDWPRFWTDGQRTELGERMRAASEWGHRAAELTNIAPPMTPPDDLR
jgi:GNAT superfamily N-acetyltransferase